MGSNVVKTWDYKLKALDNLDFKYIYLYALYEPPWVYNGGYMDEALIQSTYNEMYAYVQGLLTDYNNTGKTFYLGHWEGDWYLAGSHPTDQKKISDNFKQSMPVWLNARQQAVDDAKRDTPHNNVYVWHYAESNMTSSIAEGYERLVNTILPYSKVDYLSYSAYDIQDMEGQKLNEWIDYMDSMIPAKSGVPNPGKRVFAGEMGKYAMFYDYDQEAHNTANLLCMSKFFDAGISQILYWQMYCNEPRGDTHAGHWLIDNKGEKWKLYYSFKAFYCNAKEYVREYIAAHGKTPDTATFNAWASAFLKTLL